MSCSEKICSVICPANDQIQSLAKKFAEEVWRTPEIDVLPTEDTVNFLSPFVVPEVERVRVCENLEDASGHAPYTHIVLVGCPQPGILTEREALEGLSESVHWLQDKFPGREVVAVWADVEGQTIEICESVA